MRFFNSSIVSSFAGRWSFNTATTAWGNSAFGAASAVWAGFAARAGFAAGAGAAACGSTGFASACACGFAGAAGCSAWARTSSSALLASATAFNWPRTSGGRFSSLANWRADFNRAFKSSTVNSVTGRLSANNAKTSAGICTTAGAASCAAGCGAAV